MRSETWEGVLSTEDLHNNKGVALLFEVAGQSKGTEGVRANVEASVG